MQGDQGVYQFNQAPTKIGKNSRQSNTPNSYHHLEPGQQSQTQAGNGQTGITLVKQKGDWPIIKSEMQKQAVLGDTTVASSGQSTASQITILHTQAETANSKQCSDGIAVQQQTHLMAQKHQQKSQQPLYQQTTEVLSARQIVQGQNSAHGGGGRGSREDYAIFMQREKRQTKQYVPKRKQQNNDAQQDFPHPRHDNWINADENLKQMPYHPLRRQTNYQTSGTYQAINSVRHIMGPNTNLHSQRGGHQRRKHLHHHDGQHAGTRGGIKHSGGTALITAATAHQHHGFPMTGNMMATVVPTDNVMPVVSQVKVLNDCKKSHFTDHPVHALQAQPQQAMNLQYVARSGKITAEDRVPVSGKAQFQQLYRQGDIASGNKTKGNERDIMVAQQSIMMIQHPPQSLPYSFVSPSDQQNPCLRFNGVAQQQVTQGSMNLQNPLQGSSVPPCPGFTPMRQQSSQGYNYGYSNNFMSQQLPPGTQQHFAWQQAQANQPPPMSFMPVPHQHTMQVVSTPLRMKTANGIQNPPPTHQPFQQQQQLVTPPKPTKQNKEELCQKEEHIETFECLTNCTEWYLIVQVGNSQVKIPAKNLAVRYSNNPHELPILTKDMDLIENLVRKETQESTSETQVVALNRAVGAGFNPSSSNNKSNSGYRNKEHVIAAQRDYNKALSLDLVGDPKQEHQQKYPLNLPISNNGATAETRLVDLYMHHRTQQLMCLEFDVTHLKLDEVVDQSFSGDYSDNFSSSNDASQPTPFLGVPKNQSSAFGQPSCVLYINEGNSMARQLRCINQDYVDRTTYFSLNGECHGKLVFEQDLKYQVQGKKVIKSIQERLIHAKEHIYNETIRIDPGVAVHQHSISSRLNSKSNGQERHSEQNKPHKRTQKSILSMLRSRNKKNKGPFLRRSDQIHIPIVNVAKSLGFKMHMSNLASIDNMLTNFNQIVMQEGVIQSFFFSFDLPVHQLSTSTPTVSNSLVVKMPKDIAAGGSPQGGSYQQQAAYLAYQQHQALLGSNQQQMMYAAALQAQPELSPCQVQIDVRNQRSPKLRENMNSPAGQVQSQNQPLWNLVDEFQRISQEPSSPNDRQNQVVQQIQQPQQIQVPAQQQQLQSPFTYRVILDQKSPFSQHFASSSANSNCSSNFQQPPILSCISSLASQGEAVGIGSNLQTHVSAEAAVSSQSSLALELHPSRQLLMLPQPQQMMVNPQMAQPLHQALYQIGNNFNPVAAGGFSFSGACPSSGPSSTAIGPPQGPSYVPPEDPNYLSNLDRLLEAITPRVSGRQLKTSSVHDFFKAFKRSSVFGLRVELLNEQTLQSEIFTFQPTLSSLVLSYTKPLINSTGDRINQILDFEGTNQIDSLPSSTVKPLIISKDQSETWAPEAVVIQAPETAGIQLGAQSTSSTKSRPDLPKSHQKFIEIHESDAHYQRPAFFSKIKEIMADLPHLKQVLLKPGSFKFESSWFSVLWTCQRVCEVPSDQQESTAASDNGVASCSSVSNIQFLAIFRFRPDPCFRSNTAAHNNSRSSKKQQRRTDLMQKPVELVGLMPYKYECESFWVSPSHLQTDNNLQGEMYDQICEDNIILLQDLKQRAIEFLQVHSNQQEYMHDFSYLLNSTNSSIFEIF